MRELEITNEQIEKARLTAREKKVIRSFLGISLTCEDEQSVQCLDYEVFETTFLEAMQKIRDVKRTRY